MCTRISDKSEKVRESEIRNTIEPGSDARGRQSEESDPTHHTPHTHTHTHTHTLTHLFQIRNNCEAYYADSLQKKKRETLESMLPSKKVQAVF